MYPTICSRQAPVAGKDAVEFGTAFLETTILGPDSPPTEPFARINHNTTRDRQPGGV